jgi:hypothetical protein
LNTIKSETKIKKLSENTTKIKNAFTKFSEPTSVDPILKIQ